MKCFEKQLLASFLKDYGEVLGSRGCNDWKIPYKLATWKYILKIHEYGVKNKMWDEDSGPSNDGKYIYWIDFIVVAYLEDILSKK